MECSLKYVPINNYNIIFSYHQEKTELLFMQSEKQLCLRDKKGTYIQAEVKG